VLVPLAAELGPREILAVNPGVPGDPDQWSYIGYKGGSEPGVLTMAWAYETSEAKSYVLAASLENGQQAFGENIPIQLLAAIRDFTPQLE
jgi:hypothetical protein